MWITFRLGTNYSLYQPSIRLDILLQISNILQEVAILMNITEDSVTPEFPDGRYCYFATIKSSTYDYSVGSTEATSQSIHM